MLGGWVNEWVGWMGGRVCVCLVAVCVLSGRGLLHTSRTSGGLSLSVSLSLSILVVGGVVFF